MFRWQGGYAKDKAVMLRRFREQERQSPPLYTSQRAPVTFLGVGKLFFATDLLTDLIPLPRKKKLIKTNPGEDTQL